MPPTNLALDPSPVPVDLAVKLHDVYNSLEGWCPEKKALWLASLVLDFDISLSLEIGVYGGRSILPVALAMKHAGGGTAFGVEPWSNEIAQENETDALSREWWGGVDLVSIKRRFLEYVCRADLTGIVRIVEAPSDLARGVFGSDRYRRKIGLLHIDGSHNEAQAMRDVTVWTDFVQDGGIVVLDDIHWDSVARAKAYMDTRYEKLDESTVPETGDGFATYRITRS